MVILATGLESVVEMEPMSRMTIIPNNSMQSSRLQDITRQGFQKATPKILTSTQNSAGENTFSLYALYVITCLLCMMLHSSFHQLFVFIQILKEKDLDVKKKQFDPQAA